MSFNEGCDRFRLGVLQNDVVAGLLPFWGKTDDRRPIEVELVFDNATRKSTSGSRNATPRVEVMIRMTPLGWIKQPEVFQKRAARVFRLLKDYFVAD